MSSDAVQSDASPADASRAVERPSKPLNPRQARFVEEYLKDLNGTQAAIRAGYSPPTAQEQASRLLSDVIIANAVERAKATRSARVGITQDEVLDELAILAMARIEHYVISDDGQLRPAPDAPEGVMAAVQSIDRKSRVYKNKDGSTDYVEYEIKFKLWDKPGQLKILGRHAGAKAFFDKVEVSGPNGGPIPIQAIRSVIVDPKTDA